MASSRIGFLCLPPELREKIYKYLLPADVCYEVPYPEMSTGELGLDSFPPRVEGVVFTNKLILREAGYLVLFRTRYDVTIVGGHGTPTAEVEASLAHLYKRWCTHIVGPVPARRPYHNFRLVFWCGIKRAHATSWAQAIHRLDIPFEAGLPEWEGGPGEISINSRLKPTRGDIDSLQCLLAAAGRRSAEPWEDVRPEMKKMCIASGMESHKEKLARLCREP